jgi:NADH:quinone reductase (non-electrogenic)
MAGRPRVVIIGGGFAGLKAARKLANQPVGVTVIDRNNHHTFQMLLYQVATGTLAPSDITAPIRFLLRKQRNARVVLGEATGVDVQRRVVFVDEDVPGGEHEVPYDYLIVAAGTRHAYFGHDEWEPVAPGLKGIDDALEIRRRFLMAFERAELTEDPAERLAFQTFVVVGGGPTGVEIAGLIPDVATGFRRDFRNIDTRKTRVVLVEAGPRILSTYPEELSARALRDLHELGVEVRLGAAITDVTADAAYIGDERIPTHTVLWAAGNAASPLTRSLDAPVDRAGRVLVSPDLSVPGHPEIFVAGDAAFVMQDGRPVPGVAAPANQMGTHAAKNILHDLRDEERRPFRYFNKGDLATIGRYRAIGDFGWFQITGFFAWWFWLFLHIMYLVGFRNRLSVLLQWAYSYFTYQRGVRLITHMELRRSPQRPAHTRESGRPAAR